MDNLHTLIPQSHLAAVERALQEKFDKATVSEIEVLAGGLSASTVYKLVVNNTPYVLKTTDVEELEGGQPLSCMGIAAAAGIAPPVLYLNRLEGVAITGFIQHTPLQGVFRSPERLLTELAGTIRRIHELPGFPAGSSLTVTVDGLIAEFKSAKMLTGAIFNTCFAAYEMIKKHYPWGTEMVASHNDLNPGNIVCDGSKVWVIDWDAAHQNDRYVDLAITANFYVSNSEQEGLFLGIYFGGSSNSYQQARFFLMRQVCYIVFALLMFRIANKNKPADIRHDPNMDGIHLAEVKRQLDNGIINLATYQGQFVFGKALLNEALAGIASSRFAGAIGDLV